MFYSHILKNTVQSFSTAHSFSNSFPFLSESWKTSEINNPGFVRKSEIERCGSFERRNEGNFSEMRDVFRPKHTLT